MIEYRIGNDLDLNVVLDLYRASTLGERRPIDDRPLEARDRPGVDPAEQALR